MPRLAVETGKGGRTKVPTPGAAPSFVVGSRPPSLRAPAVPNIKPTANRRDYGKPEGSAGFGITGLTSRS